MFCNHCGAAYPDGSNYCPACGRGIGGKAPTHEVPISPGQENPAGAESEAGPKREPTREDLFRRIEEVEKRIPQRAAETPEPVQAPRPENFGLPPHEDRKGFIRRVREAIHGSTCRMKLELLALNRTTELLRRGMARNLAEEQACKELGLFLALLEKRDIDTSTKQGILFVEGNFPAFTGMLDSTPRGGGGGEDSTRLKNSELISRVRESEPEKR